ncbi:hypothetical protein ONZ45_g3017 [Pleurotus djamor]|nr:hypothetical protein ONZ45_g3017 [Pleurotus djamor]
MVPDSLLSMRLYLVLLCPTLGLAAKVSTFAGATSVAVFPPSGATFVPNNPNFPGASQVGFSGATPTGDEAFVIATAAHPPRVKSYSPLIKPHPLNNNGDFDLLQHLGNLSPFKSVDSLGLPNTNEGLPDGCEGTPAAFASKFHGAAASGEVKVSSPLGFLKDWTMKLGADGLNLGVAFRMKYGELLKDFDALPVFRTTSQARMVDSAVNFAVGFFGVPQYLNEYNQLIIIEADGFNNTLASGLVCPNANNDIGTFGRVQSMKWANVYLQPTLTRLQRSVDGLELSISDLVAMQMTCAYETVALGFSHFCKLFNQREWQGFAYFHDLLFWYSFGPGNPSVAAQGVGYVQELLSRLTQTRITKFNTSLNATLTQSNATFPLNQPIYVDATHDSVMTAIFTALNFTSLAANGPLPTDHIPDNQSYFVQQLAPFGANAVGQVLTCGSNSQHPTHIRWLINDAVVPLTARMRLFVYLPLIGMGCVAQLHVSTFAGSPATTVFPPPGITQTANDPNFPPHPGGVPIAGEAEVIATAPDPPKVDTYSPLIQPHALDGSRGHGEDKFNLLQHLGGLSPFQSVDTFGLPHASERIPSECRLKQVHLLHRHGARYPTSTSQGSPSAFATKLRAAASSGGLEVSPPLLFLKDWKYKLGRNDLTPYGRQQMFDLGSSFRIKYGELLENLNDLPVFRTTTSGRMVDSATLSPGEVCPNANNDIAAFGILQALSWANIYLQPALLRLQKSLKGLELDIFDLISMQMTCAYEVRPLQSANFKEVEAHVSIKTVSLGFSSFCGAFNEQEWRGFAYLNDLSVWYGGGPGNPASAAQGAGYVQELLSRLSQTPITNFSTSVNSTLAGSNITFPLRQSIYVDATHDSGMIAIFTAMNLTSFAAAGPLPVDHIQEGQSFFVHKLVPFGARLVGQVLACDVDNEEVTHIRWILNDAVVPLTGIRGCRPNEQGMCELRSFISGLQERLAEIDFTFDCFANYTIPIPDTIVDEVVQAQLKQAMGAKQSVPKITAQDRAILDLKLQRDKLRQYQKKLQVVLDREHEIAKLHLANGQKDRAVVALRQRKYQQGLLLKTDGQLENLEQLVSTIEFSLIEVSVLHGLKQGNDVLKEIHKEMNVESVEKLLEETAEAREYQREIDEMLASNLTLEEEEAVQNELRELQELTELETVPNTVVELPSVPTEDPVKPIEVHTPEPASEVNKVAVPG